MAGFRYILGEFMENLGDRFEGSKQKSLKDIEIQAVEAKGENLQLFTIGFKFNLP
jgi:hypothetical protein